MYCNKKWSLSHQTKQTYSGLHVLSDGLKIYLTFLVALWFIFFGRRKSFAWEITMKLTFLVIYKYLKKRNSFFFYLPCTGIQTWYVQPPELPYSEKGFTNNYTWVVDISFTTEPTWDQYMSWRVDAYIFVFNHQSLNYVQRANHVSSIMLGDVFLYAWRCWLNCLWDGLSDNKEEVGLTKCAVYGREAYLGTGNEVAWVGFSVL